MRSNLESWEPSQHLLIDTGKPRTDIGKPSIDTEIKLKLHRISYNKRERMYI